MLHVNNIIHVPYIDCICSGGSHFRKHWKGYEKYIFELIPDITKLDNFPEDINDETIASYFGLTDEEKNAVNSLHKKEYNYFDR